MSDGFEEQREVARRGRGRVGIVLLAVVVIVMLALYVIAG